MRSPISGPTSLWYGTSVPSRSVMSNTKVMYITGHICYVLYMIGLIYDMSIVIYEYSVPCTPLYLKYSSTVLMRSTVVTVLVLIFDHNLNKNLFGIKN